MIQIRRPEPKEPKSALNITEWIQFIKDECNSFEEEKRFVFAQLIALSTIIVVLIKILYDLLNQEITFNISPANILELKLASASLAFVVSFQVYKIISLFYSNFFHVRLLNIINLSSGTTSNKIVIFPITFIFTILFIHRWGRWALSMPIIHAETLESTAYSVLLLISGIESVFIIMIIIFERKLLEVMEKAWIDEKKMHISITIAFLLQFFILALIISVMENVQWPSYELVIIQLEFGLVFISILFMVIYWWIPLYSRLNEIAMRINLLHRIVDELLRGEITKPEDVIVLRDKLKIY